MRISKIDINPEITLKSGIKQVSQSRLGPVVALVGKNGSGKTRVLNLLENNLEKIISINRFLDHSVLYPPPSLKTLLDPLTEYKDYILQKEKVEILLDLNPEFITPEINLQIKEEQQKLNALINKVRSTVHLSPTGTKTLTKFQKIGNMISEATLELDKLRKNYFRRINYSELRNLQNVIDSADENISSFEDLIDSITDQIEYNELSSLHKSSLKFLKKLPNKLVSDYLKAVPDIQNMESKVSYKRYLALKKSFENFLHKELTWKINIIESTENADDEVESRQTGIWLIDGREFDYQQFSEGEKSLFAYSLIFFLLDLNPLLKIKDSIVVIDEPELHLHADSEIDLIESLRAAIGSKGQLWIATHSINILSILTYDEIFMVKNGTLYHPSRFIQKESLSELMSIDERVNKLSDFLISIANWSIFNFITQCFDEPDVIEFAHPNDPQVESFKKALKEMDDGRENLLLDFGAGKGRLLEQVINETKLGTIKYSALEPEPQFHNALKKLGIKEIFSSHKDIPKGKFKFIVLCNVLHEIQLKYWVDALNSIIQGLAEDGYLMIIEAKFLSKGEMIGEIGYLVLDIEELQELFGIQTSEILINKSSSNEIMCAVINKTNLKPITAKDILKAMIKLENNTYSQIEKIRQEIKKDQNNAALGRKMAFLYQLHINSKFAQKYLESK